MESLRRQGFAEPVVRKIANMWRNDQELERAITEIIVKEPKIIRQTLFMLLTKNKGKGKQHVSAHQGNDDGQVRDGVGHVVHRKGNGHGH